MLLIIQIKNKHYTPGIEERIEEIIKSITKQESINIKTTRR